MNGRGIIRCKDALTTRQSGSIEYAPVKRGRWLSEDTIFGGVPFYCSECGFGKYVRDERSYAYCPNCGAYMLDEVDEHETD